MVSLDSEALLDLSLSRGTLHRNGNGRRDGDPIAKALADADTRVIDLAEGRVLTCRVDGRLRLVHRAPRFDDSGDSGLYLGHDDDGTHYVAVVHEGSAEPASDPERGWRSLREAGADLDDTDAGVLTTAVALANWHARHRFCPRCGGPTVVEEGGWVRRCTADGSQHYPRTDAYYRTVSRPLARRELWLDLLETWPLLMEECGLSTAVIDRAGEKHTQVPSIARKHWHRNELVLAPPLLTGQTVEDFQGDRWDGCPDEERAKMRSGRDGH